MKVIILITCCFISKTEVVLNTSTVWVVNSSPCFILTFNNLLSILISKYRMLIKLVFCCSSRGVIKIRKVYFVAKIDLRKIRGISKFQNLAYFYIFVVGGKRRERERETTQELIIINFHSSLSFFSSLPQS